MPEAIEVSEPTAMSGYRGSRSASDVRAEGGTTEADLARTKEMASKQHDHPPHDPDERGHFGPYGGRFMPEALIGAMDELSAEYDKARLDAQAANVRVEQAKANLTDSPEEVVRIIVDSQSSLRHLGKVTSDDYRALKEP